MDSARRKQSAAMVAAKEAARVEAIDLANRQLEAYAEFSRYANGLTMTDRRKQNALTVTILTERNLGTALGHGIITELVAHSW